MKNVVLGIIVIITSFIMFNTNVSALDCSIGSCFCTADGSNCALMRNPRGSYTVSADMTKCGCPATVIPGQESEINQDFCVRTSAIWQFVGYGLLAVKVLVPIIIIIFGLIDFAKAMTSSDDKAIKSAALSLIKRLIIGVVIFFIPTIVTLVFDIIDNFVGDLSAIDACKTCLLNPTNNDKCDDYKSEAEALRKNGG